MFQSYVTSSVDSMSATSFAQTLPPPNIQPMQTTHNGPIASLDTTNEPMNDNTPTKPSDRAIEMFNTLSGI